MPVRKPDDDPFETLAQRILAMRPADLERWVTSLNDPADVEVVERILADHAAQGWRAHPAAMAAHLDASFRRYRHVDLLSRKFREAVRGESKRQIWSLQPRAGKSSVVQWGVTWGLDDTAGLGQFLLVSYGKELAVKNAVAVRDNLAEHASVLRTSLRRDRRRMDLFVTEQGGGVLAAGIKGRIRGFGAGKGGGLVIDDPFKDWQEAHSEHARDVVWGQYRGTLLDRLDDESAFIIIVHHRVHEDDLTGRLLADTDIGGVAWDHTCLPALALADDPLGREPGETLDPERFTVAFVTDQMQAMGSYLASGLFQQNPSPEEGNDLLRAWFLLEEQPPAKPDHAITSWDLKLKDKEAGDFVVGQAWWRTGADYWLMDQLRGQWDHATTGNAIALLSVRHPECRTHVVESAGSADEVVPALKAPQRDYVLTEDMATRLGMNESERLAVQALRRRGMGGIVREPVTDGKKPVRARMFIAPAAEAGNIHLLSYSPFVAHLLDELAAFPEGTHDDQVDAMSQALKRLTRGPASVKGTNAKRPEPRAGQPRATVRPAGVSVLTPRLRPRAR